MGGAGFARAPAVSPAPPAPADLIAEVRERMGQVAEALEELMRLRREIELRAHALEGGTAAPPPRPPDPRDALLEGLVVLEVGPFPDVAALAAFEQSVARLPSVSGAQVRAYGGQRAELEVRLARPAALVHELHSTVDAQVTVLEQGPGRLSLALDRRASAS